MSNLAGESSLVAATAAAVDEASAEMRGRIPRLRTTPLTAAFAPQRPLRRGALVGGERGGGGGGRGTRIAALLAVI